MQNSNKMQSKKYRIMNIEKRFKNSRALTKSNYEFQLLHNSKFVNLGEADLSEANRYSLFINY